MPLPVPARPLWSSPTQAPSGAPWCLRRPHLEPPTAPPGLPSPVTVTAPPTCRGLWSAAPSTPTEPSAGPGRGGARCLFPDTRALSPRRDLQLRTDVPLCAMAPCQAHVQRGSTVRGHGWGLGPRDPPRRKAARDASRPGHEGPLWGTEVSAAGRTAPPSLGGRALYSLHPPPRPSGGWTALKGSRPLGFWGTGALQQTGRRPPPGQSSGHSSASGRWGGVAPSWPKGSHSALSPSAASGLDTGSHASKPRV